MPITGILDSITVRVAAAQRLILYVFRLLLLQLIIIIIFFFFFFNASLQFIINSLSPSSSCSYDTAVVVEATHHRAQILCSALLLPIMTAMRTQQVYYKFIRLDRASTAYILHVAGLDHEQQGVVVAP